MATNKEILEHIKQGQEDMAKNHFNFAASMSTFVNEQQDFNGEQKLINNKVLGYLENDDKTDEKGIVNRVSDVEKKTSNIDFKGKVIVGVFMVLFFIGNFWDRVVSIFSK